jgi:hypothetical protein
MIVNDECIGVYRWWGPGFSISRYPALCSNGRTDGTTLHLFPLTMLTGIGARIRIQSLLPYLLLETVNIRHYLFRTRYRLDVVIG